MRNNYNIVLVQELNKCPIQKPMESIHFMHLSFSFLFGFRFNFVFVSVSAFDLILLSVFSLSHVANALNSYKNVADNEASE